MPHTSYLSRRHIFIAALEDSPSESRVHQIDASGSMQGPKFTGQWSGGGGESLCQTSTPCSSYRRSSHSKVKLNLHEDACFTWRLSVVLRTPKRKEKKKKPCGIYDGPVIYTEVLDNLDKNVTASLHVLQIHGVKPLEQLMESSHIISC